MPQGDLRFSLERHFGRGEGPHVPVMSLRRVVFGLFPLLCIMLLSGAVAPAYAQEIAAKVAPKDIVLKEDAQCTRCHNTENEIDAVILTIGKTKHGTRADTRTPTCTTCHGESVKHKNSKMAAARRNKPDRMFGKESATPAAERSATCLGCHQGSERMFWDSGTHASRDVTCSSCHQVHNNGNDKVREKKTQTEVCFGCHKKQRIQVGKPSHHPIVEGKVTCSDCHNPHGSAGDKNLARDTVNDTCFMCHAEKRGPFIWNHQPVTENCALCHDPHGTTVANLLKFRPPFLCQQCHEGDSHRNVAPVFEAPGDYATEAIFQRGCVNCHTNIHGSNNPQNTSGARSFRR